MHASFQSQFLVQSKPFLYLHVQIVDSYVRRQTQGSKTELNQRHTKEQHLDNTRHKLQTQYSVETLATTRRHIIDLSGWFTKSPPQRKIHKALLWVLSPYTQPRLFQPLLQGWVTISRLNSAESDNCKVTARDRRSVCHMHWSQGGTVAVYWLHQLRMLSARQVSCRQACRTSLQACGEWL